MNRTLNSVLPIVALSVCAGTALSQTVFTQWTFNNTTAASTNTIAGNNPTVAYIGGTAAPLSGQFPSGVANQALSSSGYPLQSMSSGTAGFLFTSRTTNFDAVQVTLFPRGSGSFSRFVSFEYSTNGGTSFTPFQTLTIPGAFLGAPVVIDLSSVPAVSNNPAFQFRLVSVFAVDAFTANSVMFAGNSAYQPVGSGVTQVYGGGQTTTSSTFRVDNVTIQGNPLVSLPPTGTGRGGPVCRGQNVLLTVTPVPGANPVSASYTISANLSGIGGSMTQAFNDQGLDGDAAFGDGVHSYSAAVGIGVTPGQFSLPFSVTDDQARVGNGNIALGVGDCAIDSGQPVVISEVYGGGGAGGAFYRADFVELYNRSANVVSLGGLTVQYASAANPAGFTDVSGVVALSGVINPGQYMLVKMSANGASGIFLPQPDFTVAAGFSGMAAIAARVALTNSATPVGADCANIAILDLVGYGQDAFCFEGAGAVPNLAADLSAARRAGGTQDSNQNFNDFDVTVPIPQGSGNPFPPTVTSPAATPAAACPGATVLLTVVAAAGANPVSLVTSVNGDLSPIGGSMTSAFTDDGLGGDALGGDGIYTFTATIAAGTTPGSKSLLVTATDGDPSCLPRWRFESGFV